MYFRRTKTKLENKGPKSSEDIDLEEPLQILVNISDEEPAEYVILSSDTN